jgi:hypothetical protein
MPYGLGRDISVDLLFLLCVCRVGSSLQQHAVLIDTPETAALF